MTKATSEYPIFTRERYDGRRALGIRCSSCGDIQKFANNLAMPADALAHFARGKGWRIDAAYTQAHCPACVLAERERARAAAQRKAEELARERDELLAGAREDVARLSGRLEVLNAEAASLRELGDAIESEIKALQDEMTRVQATLVKGAAPRRLALVEGRGNSIATQEAR